ncbi:MAG: ABC transporter substrate-binding protein [Ilumatobacter sp.]|uniref:ABC transporter substrate-binding protein n=1 Tax=Ilumatobacter sp. TaxID=1967498 RepID=UPI0032972C14
MRIVSLIPSATEIVFALGLADELVGVTFECDFPPDPRRDRHVVVGGLDTQGLSPESIDRLVREKIAAGDDLYRLDEDRFLSCDPTHVLTQDLCRVCALPSGEADAALERLGCDADVTTLDPHTLDDVLATIVEAGRTLGVDDRAARLVDDLRSRIDAVTQRVGDRERPSVFVLEWSDPPFLSGHWVPDLVVAAGATPVLAETGGRSVPTEWDTIAEHDPDIVVVAPCGFGLDGASEQATAVLDRLPPRAQVWAIDADGLVVRPGPRLVDGIDALATIFHPDLFDGPHPSVRRIR